MRRPNWPMARPNFKPDTTERTAEPDSSVLWYEVSAQRLQNLPFSHSPQRFLSCVAVHKNVCKTKIN